MENTKEVLELRSGDCVKSAKHGNLMCVHKVAGDKAICDYFIEDELSREEYPLEELEFIKH